MALHGKTHKTWEESQKFIPWLRFEVDKKLEKYSVSFMVRLSRIARHLPGNTHPWWNMILWTTSLPSKWQNLYSKISLHKVTMLTFSQELIWKEICYTDIVVSGLILKMRSEDTLLEKWCISLPFHSVTLAIKADHEAAEHFVCRRGPPTKDSEKWLYLYADWLRSILYCYLLTFGKPSMLIGSEKYSITYLLAEN